MRTQRLRPVGDETATVNFAAIEREFDLVAGQLIEVTFTGTSAQTITHGLARIPVGWRVEKKDRPGDVYHPAGDPAWTNKTVSLRTDTPGLQCTIRLFS